MIATRLALAAAIAVASGAMAFAPQASAEDGTITFNGTVTDQTCSLDSPSNTGGSFAVQLPNVVKGTDIVNTVGNTAGAKPFTMKFTGCPDYTNISVLFSGTGIDTTGTNASTGLLKNSTGGSSAADVDVQLLGSDGTTALDLSNTSNAATQGTAFQAPSSGVASFDYTAQYYVTGTGLSGGSVTAQVGYTVVYQ